ncbi:hypothetical protein ACQBAR_10520 [Propionibacteriaceae bacterium Y1685]
MSSLHISVRAELKSLPTELADKVAAHLVRAGELIDTDPEQALAHAQAARRRAARLAITREAVAEAAYAAGEWSTALTEFRSLRRMTGAQNWLPVMADCERALGRPQAALKLAKEAEGIELDVDSQIEMKIVEAGARVDLGQQAEGRRLLKTALAATPRTRRFKPARARLGYAYADLLIADGEVAEARTVFEQVRADDTEELTDVAERLDELDGLAIEFDESSDDDPDIDVADAGTVQDDGTVQDER